MNSDELKLSAYEYHLPEELIAQEPAGVRDRSRLMVLDRSTGTVAHRQFKDIVEYLRPGDCLVVNRTRVVPVRLFGKKETGGRVEVLFLDPLKHENGCYDVLLKPFLEPGKKILFPGGLEAVVQGKNGQGETRVQFTGASVDEVLERFGVMPLPPYIKRKGDTGEKYREFDRSRYQTVYSREKGSIAAPTAGLHFTEELIEQIKAKGVTVAQVVLHVGWGTFRPIVADDVSQHRMLPEHYEISVETGEAIERALTGGGRVIAVGTTSVRALESAAAADAGFDRAAGKFRLVPARGETSIFIYPGYQFKVIDRMVTNFHLPHSTPLMMISALAGREKILAAYEEAIREKYRFYSYGDAMMIL